MVLGALDALLGIEPAIVAGPASLHASAARSGDLLRQPGAWRSFASRHRNRTPSGPLGGYAPGYAPQPPNM